LYTFIAVFLITLGLGQLVSTGQGWRAASLVGPGRLGGYLAGLMLLTTGAALLLPGWAALGWAVLAGPPALAVLLLAGSVVDPPPQPDHALFGNACPVQIPHDDMLMPGLLLRPPAPTGGAVCLIPGAGDHKTWFKWRLMAALLAEGLAVLSIDPPGHGDYRARPMAYPDCLSTVPAAVAFLRQQPGVKRVGVAGISLGGALAVAGLAANPEAARPVEALVVLETPVQLDYNQALRRLEAWRALRAPVLSLLREISVGQIRQTWHTGGYVSRLTTGQLINRLNPAAAITRLENMPILLVYSERDPVAPPEHARRLQQAAPWALTIMDKRASHVTLTLLPAVNRQVAGWLAARLATNE
jgi:pimeloyl-ACP methyl ester carboxylesterase